jgi:dihydroorotase-like cyclic amidohydrolase
MFLINQDNSNWREKMTDFDLVIKNARIDDDRDLTDIGISGGKISKIDKNLTATNVIDVNGDVVVPSFIESHIQGIARES